MFFIQCIDDYTWFRLWHSGRKYYGADHIVLYVVFFHLYQGHFSCLYFMSVTVTTLHLTSLSSLTYLRSAKTLSFYQLCNSKNGTRNSLVKSNEITQSIYLMISERALWEAITFNMHNIHEKMKKTIIQWQLNSTFCRSHAFMSKNDFVNVLKYFTLLTNIWNKKNWNNLTKICLLRIRSLKDTKLI